MSVVHPQKAQLIAFGQGTLAAEESSMVEQHLEVCRECCETLLDLKDDTFVGLVKIAQPSNSDRWTGTLARPSEVSSKTEPDKTGTGKSAHLSDSQHAATVLVQSGEPIGPDELPAELRDHPRYRIVELIGCGGMGNVYRAEHRLMDRPVAIKLINSQLIRHPQAVERFRREVKAAAKLSHPNIVAAYDAEQAGDVHFLVMEFVEGTDLASVVKHRGPMSVVEACECVRQAAEGLQHAHEKGMVHRDIKPHNLMLANGGQVRILDFGLAGFAEAALESSPVAPRQESRTSNDSDSRDRPSTDDPAATHDRLSCRGATGPQISAMHLTTLGSVMGTPDYMAPEQAADAHSADIRADIYSLGCTLHFLLTGKPPFEADNVIAKLKAHAQEPPPSLMTLRNDVPAELDRVVAKMMAKNPTERFQTPAEVVEALTPLTQPKLTKSQRLGLLVASVCCGLAVLLGGLIVAITAKGQLEIRSEVDDVKVVVKKAGEQVEVFDLKTGSQMKWLPNGEYELEVIGRANDVKLDKDGFQLSRWGKEVVTAKLIPPDIAATDRDRLQGHWVATSVKTGRGAIPAGAVPQWTMTFTGGNLRVTTPTNSNEGTFTLDTSKAPKEIDVEPASGQGRLRGIYRFVGEELEVCMDDSDRKRPIQWDVDLGTGQLLFRLRRSGVETNQSPTDKPAEASPFAALKDSASVLMYLNDPRNNRSGSVPVALLGQNGRVAFRFGTWLVVFEGIACDPKASILGFSSFNIPHRGSSGEGTIDFGAGDKLPGVLIKYKFANEQNEISINNHRFKLRGKATRLEFGDKAYDATNALQTILVARDGSTKLEAPQKAEDKPNANVNLLTDPSFENTGLTQLPSGWRAWLNDGPEFRCEVVAGGHTGQRCLRISGKGTRGVVFGNDLKADRTKRYALKGWVKFEGDKDARALIKLNYFRGSEFLGVHDLVGATADQPGWHLFEKTDALDAYPQADHFYAMCHVEGSGTGWFDDLELVAYDRDKLPNDFDARHGRHNRLHGPNSLNRWVGTWDTEYVFRETDNSPKETKLKMTTISERTLGNYFLMSHAVADAASISKPTLAASATNMSATNAAALGADERLLFLTFDQNIGAFRQWFFSGNGKVFEWRGPWNQETQSLELRMLPDASNLHSTEHFVDAEQIEAKLHFQYVMGQRDAGRWTATRKVANGKVDVPAAKTHAAEPAELSQLNKFAGEWTIRAKHKPSVWNPLPREETIRETSVWILGGRFLMTRAFNAKDELTSIWIATWEPKEKSNRFWFFNADGSSGEWRLTWDEPSSGFHFRAVDLPTGWTGTGFNRWVNEDMFDNSAMIKDENGRVLLDMTQDKRRKK